MSKLLTARPSEGSKTKGVGPQIDAPYIWPFEQVLVVKRKRPSTQLPDMMLGCLIIRLAVWASYGPIVAGSQKKRALPDASAPLFCFSLD